MLIKIIGIPDSNGIIRVEFGDDVLEIKVVSAGDALKAALPAKEHDGPERDIPVKDQEEYVINIGDIPMNWITAPQGDDGKFDGTQLIERIRKQLADPVQVNPGGVIVATPAANLRDLAGLYAQVDREALGLPFALKTEDRT